MWYFIAFLIIAGLAFLITRCFDDKDPDMFIDFYGEEHRPYIKNGECIHPLFSRYTHVVETAVNCETTVQKCALCGKTLTEPKTDCR